MFRRRREKSIREGGERETKGDKGQNNGIKSKVKEKTTRKDSENEKYKVKEIIGDKESK
jgi:hypothetical protein